MATKGKREHREIPYLKIVKMIEVGKSIEQIGRAIDRYDEKSDDPGKPVRAIISRMRTVGYTDADGKTKKLKVGSLRVASSNGTKTAKSTAKAKAKASATKGKPGRKMKVSKAVLITLTDDKQHVRIEADKPKSLVPLPSAMTAMVNVLDAAGYAVVAKVAAEAVAPAAEVVTAPAVEVETAPAAPEQTTETAPETAAA